MKASSERLARLSRMEEARRQTQRQIDMIDRQIIRRMTTLIPRLGRKRSGYRRGKPPDPSTFLERYRSNLAAITAERQPEIDALSRKLARQDAAIETLRARCARSLGPLVAIRSAHIARTNVAVRPTVVRGSGTALRPSVAAADLAARSGERLEHGAELGSAGLNLSAFANRARTLSALPSGLLRSAPPAARFKAESQATRNRRSRQGPAASGAGFQQAGTLLVRSRTSLAWRSPDLEAALTPAALGDRTRREVRQGPDRT